MYEMTMGPSVGQTTGTEQRQSLIASLAAATDIVCTAAPGEVMEFLAGLEQRGDIVQDALPGDEMLPCVSEGEEFDAEWDYSDEDVCHEESQYESFADTGTGPYESEDAYVIRVECLPDGSVFFDVPETGGEAYRGITMLGKKALDALSKRTRTYESVVKWLQEQPSSSFASAEDFLATWKGMPQKVFLGESHLGVAPGTFSKYVRNARLAWGGGSIPLARLFKSS